MASREGRNVRKDCLERGQRFVVRMKMKGVGKAGIWDIGYRAEIKMKIRFKMKLKIRKLRSLGTDT